MSDARKMSQQQNFWRTPNFSSEHFLGLMGCFYYVTIHVRFFTYGHASTGEAESDAYNSPMLKFTTTL